MVRNWIFLALFAIVLGNAFALIDDEYIYDYDESWWSNEAQDDDLGIVASKEVNDNGPVNDDYEAADANGLDLKEDGLIDGENKNKDKEKDEAEVPNDDGSDDTFDIKEETINSEQADIAVQEEIEQFKKDLESPDSDFDDALASDEADNAFENRSGDTKSDKNHENENLGDQNEEKLDDYELADDDSVGVGDEHKASSEIEIRASVEHDLEKTPDQNKLEDDTFNDYQVEDNRSVEIDIVPDIHDQLKDPEAFEETRRILNEDNSNLEEEEPSRNEESKDNLISAESQKDVFKSDKEEESKSTSEEKSVIEQQKELIKDEKHIAELDDSKAELDEDTVDKVYADLQEDLDKLVETWNKLNDFPDDDQNVVEYEKQFGRPYKEEFVLSQRDDNNYDDGDDIEENVDSNLDDLFEDAPEDEIKNIDSNLGDIFKDVPVEIIKKDDKPEDPLTKILNTTEPENKKNYDNDGLVADEPAQGSSETTTHKEHVTFKTADVDDLTPEEYNVLMSQFVASHKEELDTKREDFGKNVAPIHETLSTEKATVITSPNWPEAYPTNNIIDWILEGDGNGIELNVTDLDIRGALGDYLLIKPGGVDESGNDGLVFTFHLNEVRKYRFTDVNRVFVRFVSGGGWGFSSGFRMSVKLIWPSTIEEEEEPEPEEDEQPPSSMVVHVNLDNRSPSDFPEIRDEFARIVRDMVFMYLNAQGNSAESSNSYEINAIVSHGICNLNWPNYDTCLAITIAVQLTDSDDELSWLPADDIAAVWVTYVDQDPFATRLRILGISEFESPNENRILTTWTVLAVGVLISAALLGLALWRYSCFQSYTRMPTFSDTDSIRDEKRGLDLYPTPHQTLPPLYGDNDYKWADAKYEDTTRVDVGGIANSGYMRDELLDIDSDDEEIDHSARNRNSSFDARNVYEV